ncbi:MAG: Sulfide dehydrogenase [flavocytochrome C] flavoprotein chain precursor (EC [uncultured Sulfurovum sp.]|uniref:Sulfide dehydrogenase [flavocytochrome C] flavoprotein chain (EC) n=1 Tax=uncultured Sulfurovum sp. TaxID=269237 RepID=A0A6S6SXC0_9BACT|nr:MAG: Sulfide dehydrogenase [flavocytochrome C] flavoprotein chain precursor (EC [uncultured Sulfurovum sp.]
MNSINEKRRSFLKGSAIAAAVVVGIPNVLFAENEISKVVIIGGGIGGATLARYLRKFIPQGTLELTIIEPKTTYTTPFGTNEMITGGRTLAELTVGYEILEEEIVGSIVHKRAVSINNVTKQVITEDEAVYAYDFCVVATGIDFEYSEVHGLTAQNNEKVPHAYDLFNDGRIEQMSLLKQQLEAMDDGGNVVLVAPQNDYRCPPAPYERASQIAQYIKEHKPNSTISILDPKTSFAKQDSFEEAWRELYAYGTASAIISWEGAVTVSEVVIPEVGVKTIKSNKGELSADVLSYIPTMKASKFAYEAGLLEGNSEVFDLEKRWAPVNQETFESTMPEKKGIYIIGDSAKTTLPKSGYAANSEAKACAMAIVSKIKGINPIPETIITNGCYSFVGKDYAISIFQKFRLKTDKTGYDLMTQGRGTSPLEANVRWRKKEVEQGHAWYANFRKDCFGV